MKLLLVLDEMAPGGGPKFMLNLGQYLAAAGHDVTVMAEKRGSWWPELAARGLKGCTLASKPGASFVCQAQLLAADWNRQQFAVLIVNVSGFNRLAQCACHLVADETAVLFVLHGDWAELYDLATSHVAAWNCVVGVSPKVQAGAAAHFPIRPVFGIANGIELPTVDQLQALGLPTRLRGTLR